MDVDSLDGVDVNQILHDFWEKARNDTESHLRCEWGSIGNIGVAEAKMYDSEGKEIELKPGHVMVIGKENFAQFPMYLQEDEYSHSCQLVYKPLTSPITALKSKICKDMFTIKLSCPVSFNEEIEV